MSKKIFCLFLGIIYIFFTSFGTLPAKASGTDVVGSISSTNAPNEVDTISVQKRNILAYNYQMVTVTIKNNNGMGYTGSGYTGVKNITVDYKLPSGSYTQASLSRNSLTDSTFVGYIYAADAGTWTVSDITEYFFNGGFKVYFDRDEGGPYELNDGNFTVYSSDTTGPVLDSLSVNNASVLSGGNVTVTINAHDDLSDIQSAYLSYQTPNGNYIQLPATSIGNNQYQVNIPASFTAGNYSYGKFQCVDVGLTDSYNNSTYYYNYSNYSTRDLSAGDFNVKAEGYAPVLTNISIDKSSIDSGDSIKVTAQIDDASGVSVANLNYMKPDGTTSFAVFNHLYGDVYEADIPGSETLNNIGQWRIFDVYLKDIYENGIYIFNSVVYQFGDRDLSNLNFYVNYKDVTPPTIPTVNDVTDQSTSITGSAEAGSSILVKSEYNLLGSGVTDAYGNFSVTIPVQTAGNILTVTAMDNAGNTSEANQVTVRDITPPNAPTVNEVTDQAGFLDGTAEPGSTITVTSGDGFYSTNVTFYNGYYYIPFYVTPKAGTKFTVTATDAAGNASAGTDVIVKDVTPPYISLINDVTEYSNSVTGIAEAGSTISVMEGNSVLGTGLTNNDGTFSVGMNPQAAGTTLTITATDAAGNTSGAQEIIVKDATPPNAPGLDLVTDQSTRVTGTAEAGSTVTVRAGNVVLGTATSDENGNFSAPIEVQTAGTVLTVTAKDAAGNTSALNDITVADVTPPNAPAVDEVTDQSKNVTGTAEPGTTVVVQAGTSELGSAVTNGDGTFSISIDGQRSGTVLTVYVIDAASNASIAQVTVRDVTAPDTPAVNEVTDQSTSVTGTAEIGSTITIKTGSSVLGTTITKEDGSFSVGIPIQKAGTILSVTSADAAGNTSVANQLTVKDVTAPSAPVINDVTDKSTSVTGMAEVGSMVTVQTGTSVLGSAVTSGTGTFSVPIKVQRAGIKLTITAKDAAGNISGTSEMTVKDVTPPGTPTVNEVTDQSNSVSGVAEPGSTVTVKAGTSILGTSVANSYGIFAITINAQKAGAILTVTAMDTAGNTSDAKQLTVKDVTAPSTPVVNDVTDQTSSVTGTAEVGSTITVKAGTSLLGTAVTMDDATYSVPVTLQTAGKKLTVTATDAAGNVSGSKEITVKDVTAPSVPVVNKVTDKSTSVTGTAEAGAKISFKISNIEYTGTADENGNFSVEIPQQKVNTVFYVTAEDAAGNVSEPTGVVVVDITPPDIPQVNEVNDQLKEVSGTAEPGATAAVVVSSFSYETKVDENGHFSITIPELRAGMTLQVYAYDSFGNGSPYNNVTVLDKTAPQAPTANEVKDQDTSVTGSTEAGANVEVKANGTVIGTGTAGADGSFTVAIPVQKAGTNLTVAATDKAGNVSEEIGVTVKDVTAPNVPTVNEVTDKSTAVTGTAEPGSTITVKAGTSEVGTVVAKDDGTFTVSIVLQKAGTKLTVVATDPAGNVSESREVTVKDVTAPNVLTVNAINNKSTLVTGKTESYARVTVKIGTKIYTATADGSGNYKATIPVQNAGTSISITATDSKGNASAATTVTVAKVAPNMPTVNAIDNKSTSVTGRTEKNAKVTVKIGTQAFTANADVYGNYKVTIPVQNAGTSISITATDSKGNASAAATVTVAKVAPNMPTVNAINNKSASVIGKTEQNAKVTVKIGTQTFTANADVYGNYKVTIPVQNAGTSISITATDSKGNASAATTVTVAKVAPNMPIVNTVNTKATSVTGKTEKYAIVTIKIGTQTYTTKADVYGNFKVNIPVQRVGTKVYVNAKDSKGMVSATRIVTVIS